MTKKPQTSKAAANHLVMNIRRKTHQTYSAEENMNSYMYYQPAPIVPKPLPFDVP